MAAGVRGGLTDPPLVNPSFEYPALDPGARINGINDWWDSVGYSYTQDEAVAGYPETPYGDNWVELGNGRWIYQQIGTYEANMDIDISFLLGQKSTADFVGLTVELFAGGHAELAADDNPKRDAAGFPLDSVVGAVLIAASDQFNPFTSGVAEAKEMSVQLSTGTAGTSYAVGAPLWLVFSRASVTGRALIDNVAVKTSVKSTAANPDPADGATDAPRDVVLSWTPGEFAGQHDVYLGTSFDDVNNAINLDPMGPDNIYRARQGADSFAVPERLDFGQT